MFVLNTYFVAATGSGFSPIQPCKKIGKVLPLVRPVAVRASPKIVSGPVCADGGMLDIKVVVVPEASERLSSLEQVASITKFLSELKALGLYEILCSIEYGRALKYFNIETRLFVEEDGRNRESIDIRIFFREACMVFVENYGVRTRLASCWLSAVVPFERVDSDILPEEVEAFSVKNILDRKGCGGLTALLRKEPLGITAFNTRTSLFVKEPERDEFCFGLATFVSIAKREFEGDVAARMALDQFYSSFVSGPILNSFDYFSDAIAYAEYQYLGKDSIIPRYRFDKGVVSRIL